MPVTQRTEKNCIWNRVKPMSNPSTSSSRLNASELKCQRVKRKLSSTSWESINTSAQERLYDSRGVTGGPW
jgi:uncharacterized alpha-E superfamily protein